jgi:hypothetical protein
MTHGNKEMDERSIGEQLIKILQKKEKSFRVTMQFIL